MSYKTPATGNISDEAEHLRFGIAKLIDESLDDTSVFDVINALSHCLLDTIKMNFDEAQERENALAALSKAMSRWSVGFRMGQAEGSS